MDVLILGGSGYIGRRLAPHLSAAGLRPQIASRHGAAPRRAGQAGAARVRHLALDTRDLGALTAALRRSDAVVNAVAGSPQAIAEGARVLALAVRAASAARPAGKLTVVHLSSMAVYGERAGRVSEADWPAAGPASATVSDAAPAVTAYARAKRVAEAHLAALAAQGWPVAMLRPGCVWGPGSRLWVDRIAGLLATGRLGDLGDCGDGWTHGVHVDDVCEAVHRMLVGGESRIYNLAAPDSPRWNRYLHDLALAIGATPLRRLPRWRLQLDAWVAGPPLYLAARLQRALQGGGPASDSGGGAAAWPQPEPLTPSLLRLMRSPMQMDCSALAHDLDLPWTAYGRALEQGVAAWRPAAASWSARARNSGLPST